MSVIAVRAPGEGFNAWKVPGAYFDAIVEITAAADYPTGGYAFGIAQLNTLTGGAFSLLESVDVINPWTSAAATTQVFLAAFDKTNNKVQAFGMAAAVGVGTGFSEATANDAALNGKTCSLRVRAH
jgi:hypothetical protein